MLFPKNSKPRQAPPAPAASTRRQKTAVRSRAVDYEEEDEDDFEALDGFVVPDNYVSPEEGGDSMGMPPIRDYTHKSTTSTRSATATTSRSRAPTSTRTTKTSTSRTTRTAAKASAPTPITSDETSSLDTYHQDVLSRFMIDAQRIRALIMSRRKLARVDSVFPDLILRRIGIYLPATLAEFVRIPGVDATKANDFANEFLHISRKYRAEYETNMDAQFVPPPLTAIGGSAGQSIVLDDESDYGEAPDDQYYDDDDDDSPGLPSEYFRHPNASATSSRMSKGLTQRQQELMSQWNTAGSGSGAVAGVGAAASEQSQGRSRGGAKNWRGTAAAGTRRRVSGGAAKKTTGRYAKRTSTGSGRSTGRRSGSGGGGFGGGSGAGGRSGGRSTGGGSGGASNAIRPMW